PFCVTARVAASFGIMRASLLCVALNRSVPPDCIGLANIATNSSLARRHDLRAPANADKAFLVCPLAVRIHRNLRHGEPLATPRKTGVCCPAFRHWRDRATRPIENDL